MKNKAVLISLTVVFLIIGALGAFFFYPVKINCSWTALEPVGHFERSISFGSFFDALVYDARVFLRPTDQFGLAGQPYASGSLPCSASPV